MLKDPSSCKAFFVPTAAKASATTSSSPTWSSVPITWPARLRCPFATRSGRRHLIGFPGCYPNAYADRIMRRICTHPNVGAVLLVSLGCESFNRNGLAEIVRQSGRPVETLVIQQAGGTRSTIRDGRAWVEQALKQLQDTPRCEIGCCRPGRGHDLRRLRRHQRADGQPRDRQGV